MTTSVFQLVDLDRVIFDTAKFASTLTAEIHRADPELGDSLQAQVEAAYQREETFFLLRYLRHTHGDAWFDELVQKVIKQHGREAFILPGVHERLAHIDNLGDDAMRVGIITYGDDIDQHMKIRLIGLQHVPIYIADTPDKAWLIRSWQLPDGTFQLPEEFGGQVVSNVTLEDDKLRAFDSLPDGAYGVWITQYEDAEDRLTAAGVKNVTIAKDLHQSSEYLKNALGVKEYTS